MKISNTKPESVKDPNKGRKDTTLKTMHYQYRRFFPVANRDEEICVNFGVKAYSNAHILFTPTTALRDKAPVYEIVLGADHNRYCCIRRQRITCNKTHVEFENIVCGDEWRWFWIKISSNGLIEIGKKGNELPFMLWQDPYPLNIEYCSFSSWENTAALWSFECGPNVNDDDLTSYGLKMS